MSRIQPGHIFAGELELNILPEDQKTCSYDCVYCDLGPTTLKINQLKSEVNFPSDEEVINRLRNLLEEGRKGQFDRIVVSGNGDPSTHPKLEKITKAIVTFRNQIIPEKKLILMTNGMGITRKSAPTYNSYDEVVLKLDCGSEENLKNINKPLVRTSVEDLITQSRHIDNMTVQTIFLNQPNNMGESIDEWLEVISLMKPKAIHMATAQGTYENCQPCSIDELETLAAMLRRKIDIPINVH